MNAFARAQDVVVCAAGSLPGDLHKLWRARQPNTYHLEYGYSCMGYEIAGGLGVKMADPSRDVFVMVGDGSYLMMAQEIVTSVQEGYKLIIVLLDSSGYASIGGLSQSVGSGGFGTQFDYKVPVDLAANAESLGAIVFRATDRASLEARAGLGARGGSHGGDLRAGRSPQRRPRLRVVVGRAGRRSVGAAGRSSRAEELGRARSIERLDVIQRASPPVAR